MVDRGAYERFRSLTLTTYSIDHRGLIVQNLLHRNASECSENGKKHGAKPWNRMYLNAESEIPTLKKAANVQSFKFFRNVNTMGQIRIFIVFCLIRCSILFFFIFKCKMSSDRQGLSHHPSTGKWRRTHVTFVICFIFIRTGLTLLIFCSTLERETK